jgi:hypothetical protein
MLSFRVIFSPPFAVLCVAEYSRRDPGQVLKKCKKLLSTKVPLQEQIDDLKLRCSLSQVEDIERTEYL